MPKIARDGDRFQSATGHGTIDATTIETFVNGKKVARLGDRKRHWHYWGEPVYIWGEIIESSNTVIAEGKGVARIGDRLSCNCVIVEGSPDTEAGD